MVTFLYPDLLMDPSQYEKAEARWRDLWNELVRREGQQNLWKSPWLNTHFADGTPFRDGDPIFSAVCSSRRLGIRVIQLEPSGNPRELNFWTGAFARDDAEEVDELVISCALTEETLYYAADLMRQWITRREVSLSQEEYYPTIPLDPRPAPKGRRELVA